MRQLYFNMLFFVFLLLCVHSAMAQDLWDGTTATAFHGGSGTATDPYQVRTGAEWMYFVNCVNEGDDFSGKTVKLLNDIDMGGHDFSVKEDFAGTIDGAGHIITMHLCYNGSSSGGHPFGSLSGRIHHLGFVVTLQNQYNGVFYGGIYIVYNLSEGGVMEDCYYRVDRGADIFYYQPALAFNNSGTIRNCYAGGSFHIYGGYDRDGSQLVENNDSTGVIENCFANVNGGRKETHNMEELPLARYNYGELIHNSRDVAELNAWVDEHPGHSRWTAENPLYNLVAFCPAEQSTIEFVDGLFATATPSLMVTTGQPAGVLPTPTADCTFEGWKRLGKLVSPTDVVARNWTLFASWRQCIRRQPALDNMSVEVDDAAHASFQWLVGNGKVQRFPDVYLKSPRDDSHSDTITFTATADQRLMFDYEVSSEEDYDVFSAYLDGQMLVRASGEKTGSVDEAIATDGSHRLVLRYSKDDDTSAGRDMANVTNIRVVEPSVVLGCTSPALPSQLMTRTGYYYCKVNYSNTGAEVICDSVSFRYIPDNSVYINDALAMIGSQKTLSVKMKNTASVQGFQFDLCLPDGVKVAKDDDGFPLVSLSEARTTTRHTDYFNSTLLDDGTLRVLCTSTKGYTFDGNDGEVAQVMVCVPDDLPQGAYPIVLRNITVTDNNSQGYDTDRFETTLTVTAPADTRLVLDENATTIPAAAANADVRVLRTLKADSWSTICLPFAMTGTQVTEAFGDDVELADFTGYETETNADGDIVGIRVKLNGMDAALGLEANHPYVIKVHKAVSEFTIDGVDIDPDEEPVVAAVKRTRRQWSELVGTYVANTEVPEQTLFLSGNQFWYSTGATRMKAFRAYFDFYDVLTDVEEGAASRITMSLDGVSTGVSLLPEGCGEEVLGHVFDLQGRRVAKPVKGFYVMDGKKVIIK